MDKVGKGEVSEVVILVDGVVGPKEDILRRRIGDRSMRTPRVTLGGRIEVDGSKGQTGTVLGHQSTLSGSINESGGRSS